MGLFYERGRNVLDCMEFGMGGDSTVDGGGVVGVRGAVKQVAVTGWRYHADESFIRGVMDEFIHDELIVRVGDATGADAIVRQWCRDTDVQWRRYRALWTQYGKAAGPKRNEQMLTQEWYAEDSLGLGEMLWRPRPVDLLIAFPQPHAFPRIPGSGSWDCVGKAFELGIEVIIPAYR